MITRKLFLLLLLMVASCQQPVASQPEPSLPADSFVEESQLGSQLKINTDVLLKGTTEQMRIDAAAIMLIDNDPKARKILLDTLRQTENTEARLAVCKAISQSSITANKIKNKSNFAKPLINILTDENVDLAQQACEAILIFDYKEIADKLESKASDASLPIEARLNVINALKLQPDVEAIYKLLDLVDDTNPSVALAASETLRTLGVPIGANAAGRKIIKKELEQKGKDAFLLGRIKWLDNQNRELEIDLTLWRQKYLQASERIYKGISDDEIRGKFLTDYLNSPEELLKTWALSKVEEWLKGTNPQVPGYIGELLIKLISDNSKDIRLKTADLLPFMGELDSAVPLADQIRLENDDKVKLELFVALGSACRYAFSPNSKITVSPEIRKQTLDWSVEYLFSTDTNKVKNGAEVIKKILEQNGLSAEEDGKYLDALEKRYIQVKANGDPELRLDLLNIMAGLCSRQIYREQTVNRYRTFFEDALTDQTDAIRETAVEGLVYIDEKRALKQLRDAFVNDSSQIIRKRLIDLAGKVGGEDDLQWLMQKTGKGDESELAWSAILKILSDSNADTLAKWIENFETQAPEKAIGDEKMIALLEMAEQKADAEKKTDMLTQSRYKLAGLYSKTQEYEKAAKYIGTLIKTADSVQREKLTSDLVNIYLHWPNLKAAGNLVTNRLLYGDLPVDSFMIVSIENYLADANSNSDPNLVVSTLSKITFDIKDRPLWQKQLAEWKNRFRNSKKTSSL